MDKISYKEYKEIVREEINNFPIYFAYGDDQLNKIAKELGFNSINELVENITPIVVGHFILTKDKQDYIDMLKKHKNLKEEQIKLDTEGTGFIKDMFKTELINHEYGYTLELDDTLGITIDDLNKNKNLQNGLILATNEIKKAESKVNQEKEEM